MACLTKSIEQYVAFFSPPTWSSYADDGFVHRSCCLRNSMTLATRRFCAEDLRCSAYPRGLRALLRMYRHMAARFRSRRRLCRGQNTLRLCTLCRSVLLDIGDNVCAWCGLLVLLIVGKLVFYNWVNLGVTTYQVAGVWVAGRIEYHDVG